MNHHLSTGGQKSQQGHGSDWRKRQPHLSAVRRPKISRMVRGGDFMQRVTWSAMFLCLLVMGGCTSTAPIVSNLQRAPQPLNLLRARVAVFSFVGAPGYPETGRVAREIVTALLVQHYGISLVSPSKVDAYLRERSIIPSEYDLEVVRTAAQGLEADVVFWGSVNQFTPYRFDRWAPATPPYVELTLLGFRVGQSGVAKVTGRKQGGLPATIWDRQPTFEDVAQPLITQLLSDLLS